MITDLPHAGAVIDEWVFATWSPDASVGAVSGHRLVAGRAWYWSAVVRAGSPLLHLAEWNVVRRSDVFVVKAPEMWAEHHCVTPYEQWSIGNEAFFVALDDPDDALDRAYGTPTATALDLEWYASTEPDEIADGFSQTGVVHGRIEVLGVPAIDLAEAPAQRWRRSTAGMSLRPVQLPQAVAHTGLRAPFAYPDGSLSDWVLTPTGWRSRSRSR
jgi:hypothetical protein